MSQSTPVKRTAPRYVRRSQWLTERNAEDRLERHLMRQRGAGARPVNATFGFSFDFGVASSSDPAVIEQPPTKRRKTIVQPIVNEQGVPVGAVALNNNGDNKHKEGKTIKKKAKPRRKLPVDADDAREVPRDNVADDSFIAQATTKKTRTKAKQSEPVAVVEDVVAAPPATVKPLGRPRKRAEARAAIEVANDIDQDAVPIDEQIQEPVTLAKPKRGRRKQVVAEEPAVTEARTIHAELPPQETKGVASKPTRAKRGAGQVTKDSTVAAKPRAGRRKVTTADVPEVFCDAEEVQPIEVELRAGGKAEDVTHPVPATPKPTTNNRRPPSTSRPPLLEADANVIRPSVSPEKLEKNARPSKRTATGTRKKAVAKAESVARGTKKRKLHVERDGAVDDEVEDAPCTDTGLVELVTSPRPKARKANGAKRRRLDVEVDDAATEKVEQESHERYVSTTAAAELSPTSETSPKPKARKANVTKRRRLDLEADDAGIQNVEQESPEMDVPMTAAAELLPASDTSPTEVQLPSKEEPPLPAKRPLMRRDPETGAPARRETVRTVKHTTSPGLKRTLFKGPKREPQHTATTTADPVAEEAGEEDVDWLFAPIESKRAAKQLSRGNVKPTKREGFEKMADVDLDDLVTNIAAFAQVGKTGWGVAVQNDEALDSREVGGVKKASKGRRRK